MRPLTWLVLVENKSGFCPAEISPFAEEQSPSSVADGLEYASEAFIELSEVSGNLAVYGAAGQERSAAPSLPAASGLPPAHWLIRQLGDRWSLAIIARLQCGPMRFARLKKSLGTVSHRILALSLKKLERGGLISRFEQPCTPPQVTYALSALGHSLVAQLHALDAWVHENSHDILAANLRYDSMTEARPKEIAWGRQAPPR